MPESLPEGATDCTIVGDEWNYVTRAECRALLSIMSISVLTYTMTVSYGSIGKLGVWQLSLLVSRLLSVYLCWKWTRYMYMENYIISAVKLDIVINIKPYG